ncbi:MAG TPA: TlpA disulfide reductase family protein [Pirellulales bacterium]|jgi:thiol-disulfide isomerase/thioredoxin|nr:TlpA disulfide reductase family protein [Pirellulales bacterium]
MLRFDLKSSWRRYTIAIVAAVLLAPGCGKVAEPVPPPVTLEIKDYDALVATIGRHRGKVVVVDAWSTSCEPCMKEFPHLVELSREHPKVACISVSLDYEGVGKPEEQRAKVLGFLESQQARFENILAAEDSDTMLKKLGVASIPAVFVYDATGKLAKTFDRPGFTYADVGAEVRRLLGEP